MIYETYIAPNKTYSNILTYIAMQSATHTAKTPQSQIRRSKALSVSSPYNLPQEIQNSLKTKEKRLKSNHKVHGDVQKKKIKIKKFWKWVGLGRCWRTWGRLSENLLG